MPVHMVRGQQAVVAALRGADWLQPEGDKERYDARCHYLPQLLATVKSSLLRALLSDAFGEARIANGLATPSGKLARYDGANGFWTLSSAATQLQLETKYLKKAMATAGVSSDRCPNTRAGPELPRWFIVGSRRWVTAGLLDRTSGGSCKARDTPDGVTARWKPIFHP